MPPETPHRKEDRRLTPDRKEETEAPKGVIPWEQKCT